MNVLLGVTGSVATIVVGKLVETLKAHGHEVQIIATKSSLYFFAPDTLGVKVWRDEDEWPGERYERGQDIPHIELRRWADVLVIAPLSANTLAKLAGGLCDNLLTCVFRAWDFAKPVVIAPAMNTHMWESPFTHMHLRQLEGLGALGLKLTVVAPVKKTLACADVGMGAMAEVDAITKAIPSP